MTILIIEDDLSLIFEIQMKLDELGFETKYCTTKNDAFDMISNQKFDIIMLDNNLGDDHNAGQEIAMRLNSLFIPFIFMTSFHDGYIFNQMLKLKPISYFSKPLDYKNLIYQLQLFQNNILKPGIEFFISKTGSIFIKKKKKIYNLQCDQIDYIEASGNYITIHDKELNKYVVRSSIRKFLAAFTKPLFLQVHRNYLVNIKNIELIDLDNKTLKIQDNVLPIGRTFKSSVINNLPIL